MENDKISINQLESGFFLNGVELKGVEWNTFMRLATKCGIPVNVIQAEKVGKGKAPNLYSFDSAFVFQITKK